jgi:hypothetical protein
MRGERGGTNDSFGANGAANVTDRCVLRNEVVNMAQHPASPGNIRWTRGEEQA